MEEFGYTYINVEELISKALEKVSAFKHARPDCLSAGCVLDRAPLSK